MKKESTKLESLEMQATDDRNCGKLTMDQIHDLGQNYMKSLRAIVVDVSDKGSKQSAEMIGFVNNVC